MIGNDEQNSLFDQFTRGRAAGQGKKGWGLGLTLVKGFAEALGGCVEIESSPGTGTTFSVVLPRDCRKNKDASASQ